MSNQIYPHRSLTEPIHLIDHSSEGSPHSQRSGDLHSSRSQDQSSSLREASIFTGEDSSPITTPEKALALISDITTNQSRSRNNSCSPDPKSSSKHSGEIADLQPKQKSASSPIKKPRSPKNRKTYPISINETSSRPGLVSKPSRFFNPVNQMDSPTRLIVKGPVTFAEAYEINRKASKEFEPRSELYDLLNYSKSKHPDKKSDPGLFGTFSVKDFKEFLRMNKAK